jgi:hypothetical protein
MDVCQVADRNAFLRLASTFYLKERRRRADAHAAKKTS